MAISIISAFFMARSISNNYVGLVMVFFALTLISNIFFISLLEKYNIYETKSVVVECNWNGFIYHKLNSCE